MSNIKALIVDSEYNSRNLLRLLLKEYCPEIQLLGMADSTDLAYDLIEQHQPDLLFLDIMAPQDSGFDLLKRVAKMDMEVVFVTSSDAYALQAIKYQVFDYLLKPIDIDELKNTIAKIKIQWHKKHKKEASKKQALNWSDRVQEMKQISIPYQNGREFIPIKKIEYCKADGACTWIFMENGTKILSTKNLGEYEKILPSPVSQFHHCFFRIHHSIVLNLSAIRKFNRKEKYVELRGGQQITIAQRRSSAFLDILRKMNLL